MKLKLFYFFALVLMSGSIALAQPTLQTPADGATGVSLTPTLTWTAVGGATNYRVEINNDPGFAPGGIVFSGLVGAVNSYLYNLGGLNQSTTYYWRVRVEAPAVGAWSSAFDFITVSPPGPPDQPVLVYPIDNDSTVSDTPTFQWSDVGYPADSFRIQITPDPTFWYVDRTYNGITSTSFTETIPLSTGSPYYWRVRGYNDFGQSAWSAVDTFRVAISGDSLPPIAYISYPKDSATVYSTTAPLSWYTLFSAVGVTFDIEINNTGTFTGTPTYTGLTGNTMNFLGAQAETYYWKIRSVSGLLQNVWSDSAVFAIIAPPPAVTPVLSWPIGGAEIYTSSPRLNWYINTQSTGLLYDYEISTSPVLTGTPTASGLTDMYVDLVGLTAGETYYWSARSTGASDISAWAPVDSFIVVANGVAGVPILSWPTGGATVFTDDTYFAWYMNGYNTGLTYELEYSTSLPLTGIPTVTGIAGHNDTIPGLLRGTRYYWSVRTSDGVTNSAWASPDSFYTVGVAGSATPQLSWPTGGAIVYADSTNLVWYLNGPYSGITFTVQLSTASDFSALVVNQSGLSTGFYEVDALVPGGYYYWRVRSDNGVLSSAWVSDSFYVYSGVAPSRPVNGSPVANISLNITNPMLSWYLPVGSGSYNYDLQYSTTADFANAVTVSNIASPYKRLENLVEGQQYFWRVKSKSGAGNSEYSQTSSFIVNGTTGVEDAIVPLQFSVEQNYPNPFNPSTSIRYTVPNNSVVTVKIYDMLGREVKTLMNSMQQPGSYELRWNGDNDAGVKVSSGAYVYRVTAGEHTKAMKLLLLK